MPTLTPNILFNHEALEAAEFYVSVFADAEIRHVNRFGDAGPLEVGTVLTVDFVLDGQEFTAINSGVTFVPNESISFRVSCHGQEEVVNAHLEENLAAARVVLDDATFEAVSAITA